MSERDDYPAGVPCWVEGVVPNPKAATDFYGALFGWDFIGSGPSPDRSGNEYFVARKNGRDVCGIAPSPVDTPAGWATQIRVESVEETIKLAEKAGATLLIEPFNAAPAGLLGVLADPTGVVICIWEPADRKGAQLVNEPGAWAMSSLHTADLDASKTFYGEVFGWQFDSFGPATLARLPEYVGGEDGQPIPRDVVAVITPITDSVPPHWNVNFRVDNADAAAQKVVELGGSLLMPPQDAPGFRSAVIVDPQGAAFSISQFIGFP